MRYGRGLRPQTIGLFTLALTLVFIISCGTAAPEATEPQGPETQATQAPKEQSTTAEESTAEPAMEAEPTPTAEATPTPAAPEVVQQAGTIDLARAEIQRFSGHPALMQGPNQVVLGMALGESLLNIDASNEIVGMLAESWEVSDDLTQWTFHLRQGVQFHKGYGEMTAEDVVWSMQGWGENTTHPSATVIQNFWDEVETPDQYTVVTRPVEPTSLIQIAARLMAPAGSGTIITSKQQAEEIGDEAANRDTAATGSWEFVEDSTSQFWRLRAVEDHWRQTPYFSELVKWSIPEESSRLAGLETGNLDTTDISLESVPRVQEIPGVRVMSVPNGLTMRVNFYGGWYTGVGTPEQETGYDPELPWVSADLDPDSEEWARARMVRQALYMAIDWETIVDELFLGFGKVDPFMQGYGMNKHLLGDRAWWEYSPERARQLLAEAGYADGFSITVTPVMLRPFEPLTCEAMAQMWETELGLDVKLQKIAYGSGLRPGIIGRTYQGITCHAGVPQLGPAMSFPIYHSSTVWNPGSNHPWLDQTINEALTTLDSEERERLEGEIGQWLFDNALTYVAPFTLDAVWPVGPRIEEWSEHIRRADLRYLSGLEYIRPRQQ